MPRTQDRIMGWNGALAEHESEVASFITALQRVDRAAWSRAPAPGRWSPAAVALHVCRTYELGAAAAAGGPSMRLRVAAPMAWRVTSESAAALQRAARERPDTRITHAYFGPLTPRATLRLLSAHTRHHGRALAAAERP